MHSGNIYRSESLQELRDREIQAREAAANAAEAERIQRMPKNRERIGFREERSRQKRVSLCQVNASAIVHFERAVRVRHLLLLVSMLSKRLVGVKLLRHMPSERARGSRFVLELRGREVVAGKLIEFCIPSLSFLVR